MGIKRDALLSEKCLVRHPGLFDTIVRAINDVVKIPAFAQSLTQNNSSIKAAQNTH